jgi:hypothetical protein
VPLIIEHLILVLSRTVINAAVAARRDFPLEAQLEIIGNGLGRVIDPDAFAGASDHAVLNFPVIAGDGPAAEVLAVEDKLEARCFLLGRQSIWSRGRAARAAQQQDESQHTGNSHTNQIVIRRHSSVSASFRGASGSLVSMRAIVAQLVAQMEIH